MAARQRVVRVFCASGIEAFREYGNSTSMSLSMFLTGPDLICCQFARARALRIALH